MTASQEMMCYLLFDELCGDTMKNFVIGYSNSRVGAECINRERSEFRLNLSRGIYPLLVCPVSYSVKTRILCKIKNRDDLSKGTRPIFPYFPFPFSEKNQANNQSP